MREQAQQGQLALAKSLASHIDQATSQAFQAVSVLAAHPDISSLDPRVLERELSLVTTATELLDALVALDVDGAVIARSRTALSARHLPSRAKLVQGLDQVSKMNGPVMTELYRTRDGDPGFIIRAPIRRNGAFVGALAGLLYIPSHPIGDLEAGKVGEEGYAYLVDENGVGLVHPQRSRILQDLSDNPAVRQLHDRDDGIVLFTNSDGIQILSAFAKVPSAGWGVIVRRPAAEVFAPSGRMLKVMSLLLTLALTAGALAMAFLARRLSAPLLDLAAKLQDLEAGGRIRSSGLEPNAPSEIQRLAHAIDNLEQRLRRNESRRRSAHLRALGAERKLAETGRLAALGQLAAGLAHELNNPLTVIRGSARELGRHAVAKDRRWLDNIRRETARCIRLVGDLLTLSRPVVLRPAKLVLRTTVRQAWQQVQLAGWEGASLSMEGASAAAIGGDPDRFKQVLMNLLVNALQASPQERKRVVVRWSSAGKRISLEVRDHGSGMSAEVRAKAFQPFFTTKEDGTGLGLAIASSLVRAHGGRLRIEAREPGSALISDWPAWRGQDKEA